jgi:hypothetical protein
LFLSHWKAIGDLRLYSSAKSMFLGLCTSRVGSFFVDQRLDTLKLSFEGIV